MRLIGSNVSSEKDYAAFLNDIPEHSKMAWLPDGNRLGIEANNVLYILPLH